MQTTRARQEEFVAALFLGSALLFFLEAMFAKMMLPRLGGTPAVWNTCTVFYQVALFASYGYSHLLTSRLSPRAQVAVHMTLLGAAALCLPVALGVASPPAHGMPIPWLLARLGAWIGAPFFMLAATAPLLQRWFASTGSSDASDPYHLYVASNAGGLVGLVSYIVIEPFVGLANQSRIFSAGYLVLFVLIALCSRRSATGGAVAQASVAQPGGVVGPVPATTRWRWLALAAAPSGLLLAVTAHLAADVVAAPLLWMAPLGTYLITLMLAFARRPPIPHRVALGLQPIAVVAVAADLFLRVQGATWWSVALHLVAFFVIALCCHSELARTRPAAQGLTGYYLILAGGGAVGGFLIAIVAPAVFDTVIEYPLAIALAVLLSPLPLGAARRRLGVAFGVAVMLLMMGGSLWKRYHLQPLELDRSFFGVLRVELDKTGEFNVLQHGTTLHGAQGRHDATRRVPLTYYHPTGPAGQIFVSRREKLVGKSVAVIGMGAGGLAAYGRAGQSWDFYEIDPAVVRVARNPRLFTYLSDSRAQIDTIVGDARLTLASAGRGPYAMLIMDAFNSDSIPLHLLTREALEGYLARLELDGLLVFHISNRWLRVEPVLANLAHSLGLAQRARRDVRLTHGEIATHKSSSHWMVMARSEHNLGALGHDPSWYRAPTDPRVGVFTDHLSSIVRILK